MRSFALQGEFVPRPWPELLRFYSELTDAHPSMKYVLDMVESVERSSSSDALVSTTSMHDLMVVDAPIPARRSSSLTCARPAQSDLLRTGWFASSTTPIPTETTRSNGQRTKPSACSGGLCERNSASPCGSRALCSGHRSPPLAPPPSRSSAVAQHPKEDRPELCVMKGLDAP